MGPVNQKPTRRSAWHGYCLGPDGDADEGQDEDCEPEGGHQALLGAGVIHTCVVSASRCSLRMTAPGLRASHCMRTRGKTWDIMLS